MDYTVFDVETANSQRASICSIGIVRCENDRIIYEKEILVNPKTDFSPFNVMIHGINPWDVRDKPEFPEVWEEIADYFSDTVLIAHNAKSMDLCALYKTLHRYGLPGVNNQYICTLECARRTAEQENRVGESNSLDVLSDRYHVDLSHHHNALDDAKACLGIFKKLRELYPDIVRPKPYLPK